MSNIASIMSNKVSIIIPVYNVEKYLRECLDSVCNQTYKNLEIICVDDGSTDGSSAILQEYSEKDNRIIVIRQENAGLASARNTGLDAATGDWIGGVDSDDYLDLMAIEKCMKHTDGVDVICFAFRWFKEDKDINDPWTDLKFSGRMNITQEMIPQLTPHFVDKLWKRSLLQQYNVRFPLGLHFEDLGYSWRILPMANSIYCLPEKLYHYRYRSGSIMERHFQKKGGHHVLDFVTIADLCLAFWKENKLREKFNCSTVSYLEMIILERNRNRIERYAAKEFLQEAWRGMRDLIDKYELGSRLPDFPELALYYHLPPYAYAQLQKQVLRNVPNQSVVTDKALHKDMLLLANEKRIYWQYRRVQLLGHLTWGKKRRKYKEKKRYFLELLRRCQQLRSKL